MKELISVLFEIVMLTVLLGILKFSSFLIRQGHPAAGYGIAGISLAVGVIVFIVRRKRKKKSF